VSIYQVSDNVVNHFTIQVLSVVGQAEPATRKPDAHHPSQDWSPCPLPYALIDSRAMAQKGSQSPWSYDLIGWLGQISMLTSHLEDIEGQAGGDIRVQSGILRCWRGYRGKQNSMILEITWYKLQILKIQDGGHSTAAILKIVKMPYIREKSSVDEIWHTLADYEQDMTTWPLTHSLTAVLDQLRVVDPGSTNR